MRGVLCGDVTPVGANFCLLEKSEEGEINHLICDIESWWNQWFTAIRHWRMSDIDKEHVTWLCIYEVLCHAWQIKFFKLIENSLGSYVCSDDNVMKRSCMYVAHVNVRVPFDFNLEETIEV